MKKHILTAMMILGCSPPPTPTPQDMSASMDLSDASSTDASPDLPDLGPPTRTLSCAGALEGAPMRTSQGLRSWGLEVTERGVFWLRNQDDALVIGPPDAGHVTLMRALASGATLTRRADGEVCVVYTRDGVDAVAYACSPDFVAQDTTITVPVTGHLAATEYTRLCHQGGCVDGEGAYLWYQTMVRDVPQASRSTLWTARAHSEPQVSRPEDAIAAGGQPFGCVITAGDRVALLGLDESTAAAGRVISPQGISGVQRCQLGATQDAVYLHLWDGGALTELRLSLLDPEAPAPAQDRVSTLPNALGVTNAAFDLGSLGGQMHAIFEREGALRRAQRGEGEMWVESALPGWPQDTQGVGAPRIAPGPDGSLHVVTVLGDTPYYWRWCP